ncbi:MAG: 5-bromo-4-chloroindolyl phosphate hydrolysis family protein [Spirochaetes bacterium]|nr:5-bromo-4-chloroindolyl phosphate hydrolysis family protein [Spirochaetota bacterium]
MKRFMIIFLAGTAVFIVCFKFTPLGFLLSSAAAVAAVVFIRFIQKAVDRRRMQGAPEFEPTKRAAEAVAREGMEKIRMINNLTVKISDNDTAAKIKEFCRIGVEIFDDIKKNPDHIRKAKQFTNYYLDATKKIIDQYAEMVNVKNRTPEMDATVKKIEGMLDSIKDTFAKQLASLMEDDLLDINAEISVLKNTMKLEG